MTGGGQAALGEKAWLCSLLGCQERKSPVRDQGSLRGRLGHRGCTLQMTSVRRKWVSSSRQTKGRPLHFNENYRNATSMKQGSRREALIKGPLYYTYMHIHSYPSFFSFIFISWRLITSQHTHILLQQDLIFLIFFLNTTGQASYSVHKKNTDKKITLHYFKNQVCYFLH